MPIIFLIIWTLYLICHFNAEAMTIENHRDYDRKIDIGIREQIHEYVCEYLNCYAPLHIDEFKYRGTQFAAMHVTLRYEF